MKSCKSHEKNKTKNIRLLVFSFSSINLAFWCFLFFFFFMWFARFHILICETQSIWCKLLVLSYLYLWYILFLSDWLECTPSPRVTWFHVARNSTSAEFLKTALCRIPLQWNSSKSRYAEFQWNFKYSPTNVIFA